MADLSASFNPDLIATNSDAASSALAEANTASAAAVKGVAASSKVAAQSAAWESGAAVKRIIEIRLLDKDTSHTVADGIGGDFRVKSAMTVTDVGCYFDTAGTTSVTTIEIFEAGSTILSTDITVDATEKTSETAATPPVISDAAIAADGILTFNISGIASGTAGKGLVVWMEVTIP